MKLQEYQLKIFFKKYGIPIPDGHVTSIAREARQIAEEVGLPVVVKAQVLAEGRGMAGGIRLAKTAIETEIVASEILSSTINNLPVWKVLVDQALSIEKEYFILITYDRALKKPALVIYDNGSIYIETAANALFDSLERIYIDPLIGLQRFQVRDLAVKINFPERYLRGLTEICMGLWQIFCDMDALMVAVNPLAICKDQRLLALDGKITLDDNAYFRQDMLMDYRETVFGTEGEFEARKYGMVYIKLNGNIGCVMNGAGLTMGGMDYIMSRGGAPANFLDLTATVDSDKVVSALDILYHDPQVKVILVNIFGGMTHCDVIADGLLASAETHGADIPIIAAFDGTKAEEGCQKLAGSDIILANSFPDAVEKALSFLEEIRK